MLADGNPSLALSTTNVGATIGIAEPHALAGPHQAPHLGRCHNLLDKLSAKQGLQVLHTELIMQEPRRATKHELHRGRCSCCPGESLP
jgi:hypothetical protein